MNPLALDPKDAITVVTGIVTVSGVVFALRAAVAKLEAGQVEILRQLTAVHKRLDHHGDQISAVKEGHARMDERIKALKESQRFHLKARLEAARVGEPPILEEDGE